MGSRGVLKGHKRGSRWHFRGTGHLWGSLGAGGTHFSRTVDVQEVLRGRWQSLKLGTWEALTGRGALIGTDGVLGTQGIPRVFLSTSRDEKDTHEVFRNTRTRGKHRNS